MTLESNKDLVRTFMQLFSEVRLEEAFEMVSDDVVWSLWGSGPAAGT